MLIVSNFHYIRKDFNSKYPSIFGLTPLKFEEHLIMLSKHGKFLSQKDVLSFVDKPMHENYILITFDDGLSEQFKLAKPILDKLGIPFLCFINTSNFSEKKVSLVHKTHIVRSEFSSKEILYDLFLEEYHNLTEQEKQLAKENYVYDNEDAATLKYLLNFKMTISQQDNLITPLFNSIKNEKKACDELYFSDKELDILFKQDSLGSHSHNHIPLGLFSEEEIKKDINNSQIFFRKRFGKEAFSISYPYGSFEASRGLSKVVNENNFKLGFTMERSGNYSLEDNPFMIARFDCNDLMSNNFTDIKDREWYQRMI